MAKSLPGCPTGVEQVRDISAKSRHQLNSPPEFGSKYKQNLELIERYVYIYVCVCLFIYLYIYLGLVS